MNTPLWRQFHRLLLGAVVESLLPHAIDIDLRTLDLRFEDDSVFKVPRLDNYMRFVGVARGQLRVPLAEEVRVRLLADLLRVWPEIVSVLDIPIGDSLTVDRHHVSVTTTGDWLEIRFDLSAD
ncbi:MAG: hypothetical protein Q8P18_21240 [Pseudomonadota bacterium]|nr:hypothetical protein [Pseudomonadota bacterium]